MTTDGHGWSLIATDCHGLHLTCPRLCPDRLTQPPSPLSGGESTLYQLDLSEMELGDTGGRKIFEALLTGRCRRITSLILSSNGLSDETARVMHQLLQNNEVCTLTSLDLSHNIINAGMLSRAIKRNTTLKFLNVKGCGLSEESLSDIGDYLLSDDCKCVDGP